MDIINKNKVMVFRYDGQYGSSYSIGLSKKDQNGKYINGYMPVRFRKGAELENKTEIEITKAWLDFNVKDKKTYPFIFISEFKTLNEEKQDNTKEYEDFGKEIELTDEDYPF